MNGQVLNCLLDNTNVGFRMLHVDLAKLATKYDVALADEGVKLFERIAAGQMHQGTQVSPPSQAQFRQ